MNRRKAAFIVVLSFAIMGSIAYYASFLQHRSALQEIAASEQEAPKKEVHAQALLLMLAGSNGITDEAIYTQIAIIKSQLILSNALRRLNQLPLSKQLPADQKERVAFLADHLQVGRENAAGANTPTSVIFLDFHANDGEMAKTILEVIIETHIEQTRSMSEEAGLERMQLLKSAIAQNVKKVKENVDERDLVLMKARKEGLADPKIIESRIASAREFLNTLRIQQVLADNPAKIAKWDAMINETAEKIAKDEVKLSAIQPLLQKLAALDRYIEERTKLIDQYEADLLAADLARARSPSKFGVLQPPTVMSQK